MASVHPYLIAAPEGAASTVCEGAWIALALREVKKARTVPHFLMSKTNHLFKLSRKTPHRHATTLDKYRHP
jgi:hypothetical protein